MNNATDLTILFTPGAVPGVVASLSSGRIAVLIGFSGIGLYFARRLLVSCGLSGQLPGVALLSPATPACGSSCERLSISVDMVCYLYLYDNWKFDKVMCLSDDLDVRCR